MAACLLRQASRLRERRYMPAMDPMTSSRLFQQERLVAVLWLMLIVACGGRAADALDASLTGDGGTDATVTGVDARSDASPHDGGVDIGFVVVDGGRDCNLPDSSNTAAYNTCCAGSACAGQCMRWLDGGPSFCGCAGLTTGCPSGYLCCPGDNPEGTCVTMCPKSGVN